MRRAYRFLLITSLFALGCAQNNVKTVGFPGNHQDRLQATSRDYDQREQIDDDTLDFRHGNFDPDPDYYYF
jgi:hypothetical protein